MKNAKPARIAMAVSAALALVALGSSAAAQIHDVDRQQECETLAWERCYYPGAPGGVWSFRCWHDTYDSCMEWGPYSAVNAPDARDRRFESQLA